jgi:hypothetical protein
LRRNDARDRDSGIFVDDPNGAYPLPLSATKSRRIAVRAVGPIAIMLVFFFGTLYWLDWLDPDVARKKNANALIAALERYYAANGAYPILPVRDSLISELAGPLVRDGYIPAIPSDAPGVEPTHYYSFDGKAFGLWLHFKASLPCKIAVRDQGKDWWGGQMAYCQGIGAFGW